MTTVATPRKKPGRLFPSMTSCNPFTSRNVPLCLLTSVVIPLGYRASTGGRNKAEILRDGCAGLEAEARAAMSASRVRGYVARSSCGANWAGLTKIETIVWSHSDSEAALQGAGGQRKLCEGEGGRRPPRLRRPGPPPWPTRSGDRLQVRGGSPRLRCPWCKAPIVGTNPTDSRRSINSARHLRSAATEVRIGNGAGGSESIVQGRFARSQATMRERQQLGEKWSDETRKFSPTSARRIRLAGLSLSYTLHLKIVC